ncbi:hypothetical protein bcCo53_001191 (plasmid) [Borrelia coriaceae]|uniref:Protein BptA n=1 Tax=Borrelia coriaceae ATCC 43381 TaxID=1408429 RepID=W5SVY9_9SPIR|nr:hypothetical protein [Borrelia coriaceae]AHH11100.1 hypothetical protein BCO_0000705 [Borrelia coriaceae ATCC 43381]UPA17022.1 hypothetical protein bcCo53_001191 [Borrelia coriaceae]
MYVRSVLVVCRVFVFCVLGVFLLSGRFDIYCDRENSFCYKNYAENFKSGSILSIYFEKRDMTDFYVKNLVKRLKVQNEEYLKLIEAGFPEYMLKFVIVGEHRAVNIKKVIFDGVEGEVSIFHLFEPSAQLALIKDFQMGPPDANAAFIELIFPVPVHNVFEMRLKKPFVEKLKAKDKIKITLISTYDKEFVVETDNFIKKYDF